MTIRSAPLPLALLLFSGCASAPPDPAPSAPPLWMEVSGEASPTFVFISGNGADSTAWDPVLPEIQKMGVTTVVYDRAGLGQSPAGPEPYLIEDERDALMATLKQNGVEGPIVMVAHSYGGLIAVLAAEENDVSAMVFIDAMLPAEMTTDYTDMILAQYRPQYEMVREQAPALAKVVIPIVEAFPATAERMAETEVRMDMPFIDIRAENRSEPDPDIAEDVRLVHERFVAQSPYRSLIVAKGSGHNVMKDRPDVVVNAINQVLKSGI